MRCLVSASRIISNVSWCCRLKSPLSNSIEFDGISVKENLNLSNSRGLELPNSLHTIAARMGSWFRARTGSSARLFLAYERVLSSALASRTSSGKPLASSRRKSTKPFVLFSKSSPSALRSVDFRVTPGSRRIFAGALPSSKKRQPEASSSLLILMRAVASFTLSRPSAAPAPRSSVPAAARCRFADDSCSRGWR